MGIICTIRFCDVLSRWVQPPDAENRMSGGVGGITGAIPLSPPDQTFNLSQLTVISGLSMLANIQALALDFFAYT